MQDAETIVELWEKDFNKSRDVDRMLALLYLANDILQNSRKKGPQFITQFYTKLPAAMHKLLKAGGGEVSTWPLARTFIHQSLFFGRKSSTRQLLLHISTKFCSMPSTFHPPVRGAAEVICEICSIAVHQDSQWNGRLF